MSGGFNHGKTSGGGSGVLDGVGFYDKFVGLTTPGLSQTLITFVVPGGTTRSLIQVLVSCRMSGKLTVELNASIIATLRTGPGNFNANFRWVKPRPTVATDTVVVKFLASSAHPATDLEAFIEATDT